MFAQKTKSPQIQRIMGRFQLNSPPPKSAQLQAYFLGAPVGMAPKCSRQTNYYQIVTRWLARTCTIWPGNHQSCSLRIFFRARFCARACFTRFLSPGFR